MILSPVRRLNGIPYVTKSPAKRRGFPYELVRSTQQLPLWMAFSVQLAAD